MRPFETVLLLADLRAVFENLPGYGYLLLAPGMFHTDFSSRRSLPGSASPGPSMHGARIASSMPIRWRSSIGT